LNLVWGRLHGLKHTDAIDMGGELKYLDKARNAFADLCEFKGWSTHAWFCRRACI
jgi:hypothetical protein